MPTFGFWTLLGVTRFFLAGQRPRYGLSKDPLTRSPPFLEENQSKGLKGEGAPKNIILKGLRAARVYRGARTRREAVCSQVIGRSALEVFFVDLGPGGLPAQRKAWGRKPR